MQIESARYHVARLNDLLMEAGIEDRVAPPVMGDTYDVVIKDMLRAVSLLTDHYSKIADDANNVS